MITAIAQIEEDPIILEIDPGVGQIYSRNSGPRERSSDGTSGVVLGLANRRRVVQTPRCIRPHRDERLESRRRSRRLTQVSRISPRNGARGRIEDPRTARFRQRAAACELRGYSADEDADVLHLHRITAIPRKFFEVKDRLGNGRLKLRGHVVDAEAPVAEP
jgi:hypothetical protein